MPVVDVDGPVSYPSWTSSSASTADGATNVLLSGCQPLSRQALQRHRRISRHLLRLADHRNLEISIRGRTHPLESAQLPLSRLNDAA